MIKICKFCGKEFQGTAKQKYCPGGKCKKNYENSLRSKPKNRDITGTLWNQTETICRPPGLNGAAAAFWDKVAPVAIARGHINVLSEDAFAELCDLYSRLKDINKAINEARRPQIDSQMGSETAGLCDARGGDTKESALSDLKRKYSKQFLDYCREFYLTPRVNRGNFGLNENDGNQEQKDDIFD